MRLTSIRTYGSIRELCTLGSSSITPDNSSFAGNSSAGADAIGRAKGSGSAHEYSGTARSAGGDRSLVVVNEEEEEEEEEEEARRRRAFRALFFCFPAVVA